MDIETHPFGVFVPPGVRCLLLGSFPGRHSRAGVEEDDPAQWFYGSPRNQFWPILEAVYGVALPTRASRQALMARLGMAVADIIHQCRRSRASNLDTHLTDIVYQFAPILGLLDAGGVAAVYCTSRWVQERFERQLRPRLRHPPGPPAIILPSPSPRFARMTFAEKVRRYRELLPELSVTDWGAADGGGGGGAVV